MSDEAPTSRRRRELKSCLKCTPPITPELSAEPSPCTSGRTSPSLVSDSGSSVSSGGRKTVVFCSDDELEEVHVADEWDRTPSAMTPKLSYQCVSVSLSRPSSHFVLLSSRYVCNKAGFAWALWGGTYGWARDAYF